MFLQNLCQTGKFIKFGAWRFCRQTALVESQTLTIPFVQRLLQKTGQSRSVGTAGQRTYDHANRTACQLSAIGIGHENATLVLDFQHAKLAKRINGGGNCVTAKAKFPTQFQISGQPGSLFQRMVVNIANQGLAGKFRSPGQSAMGNF